jgi:hypothetical protein
MKLDLTTKNLCRVCHGRGFIPYFGQETLPDGSTKPLPVEIIECICQAKESQPPLQRKNGKLSRNLNLHRNNNPPRL